VGGEHSRKEPLEQLVNSNSEHLHSSAQPGENGLIKKVLKEKCVDLVKLLDGIVKKRVGKGAALLLAQLFASGSRGKCHRDRHAPSQT
jgi:hypothetical protein